MSRSTAALLIAIMFHILLLVLFYFLMHLSPKRAQKPEEERIKVSLREKPSPIKKSAALENKIPPAEQAPPMPKGKQLEKIVKKSLQKKALPEQAPKRSIPEPAASKPIETPAESFAKKRVEIEPVKKPAYKHIEKTANEKISISKTPEKSSGLYAALSKKQKPQEKEQKKAESGTHISPNIQEAYGDAFGKLSEGEQKYIIDNQEIMRRITQEQLNRLGPVNIPRNLNVNTTNTIEFYLHPNGDISGLKITNASGYEILDETSLQTIEYSYHRYPLPKQKTLIRYKVGYYLGRY